MTLISVATDRHRDANGRLWILTRRGWRLWKPKKKKSVRLTIKK